ncbi:hypothetical protein [Escherichia coli]|nr:hypothetical protein [Escherichia coli]
MAQEPQQLTTSVSFGKKGFEAALALQEGNGTRLPEDFKNDDE